MRDKTKFLILGIIIASFLCIGVVGCAALFGTAARTDTKYRLALAGETPDGELWAGPPAYVKTASGTQVVNSPSLILSGSATVKEEGKVEVPATPGMISGANQILTATGAANTPWGGIATLAIGLVTAIGGVVVGKRAASQATVTAGATLAHYEASPASGPDSAMASIAAIAGEASKLMQAYQAAKKA